MLGNFGPSQGRKGLESGPIWDHKWLKNGSKTWFWKNDPSPVVVPKRMNTGGGETSPGENFAGKISPLRKVAKFSPGEILA